MTGVWQFVRTRVGPASVSLAHPLGGNLSPYHLGRGLTVQLRALFLGEPAGIEPAPRLTRVAITRRLETAQKGPPFPLPMGSGIVTCEH